MNHRNQNTIPVLFKSFEDGERNFDSNPDTRSDIGDVSEAGAANAFSQKMVGGHFECDFQNIIKSAKEERRTDAAVLFHIEEMEITATARQRNKYK